MRSLKLILAYDGTGFGGWQVQPNARSIQQELESAIEQVTGATSRATASGRTDAGVHALGQVVGFHTTADIAPRKFVLALNAYLPEAIRVLSVEETRSDFHPIRDAVAKRYRYTICHGPVCDPFRILYSWHHPRRLDVELMRAGAQHLIGRHDFAAFQAAKSDRLTSVRTVMDLTVRERGDTITDVIEIEIEADGFLYNMVRNIVGTLVDVGRGYRPPEWIKEVRDSLDRDQAGMTAPPQGLTLVRVTYGED